MSGQDHIIESQKITAVGALEEIAEITGTVLEGTEIANLDFPFPRIYRLVRAIDNLARAELASQVAQEKAMQS